MNLSTAADVLLIAAVVVWVLAKQVRMARVKPRPLLLAPLSWPTSGSGPARLDLACARRPRAARGERVLSPGLGAWRGQTIQVWRDADGTWRRRRSALTSSCGAC